MSSVPAASGKPPSLSPATPQQSDLLARLDGPLLDMLPVAVYFCDPEGRLLRWNRNAAELWGRCPRRDVDEWYCGSFRLYQTDGTLVAHADCPMAQVLRTGQSLHVAEAILERPDGTRRFFSATIDPLHDSSGRLLGAVNVLQDITDRKLAEKARQHHETRFRHLLEYLPAAAYTCDSEGLITFFNSPAQALWGRAPRLNAAEDRYCGSFRLYTPEGVPILHEECWMALALKNGAPYTGKEIVIERPDGSRRNALAYATPLPDDAGGPSGAVNILVDITHQKHSQSLIHELLLREREQSEKLKEAAGRKDEFLAMLAHELRNPLAPIRSGLELLAMAEAAERETVSVMRGQVDHLVRLVDDLLDVSRIVRGRIELRCTLCEVGHLLEQSINAVESSARSRRHTLTMTSLAQPVWLNVDGVRINQVLENLLHNAIKYTDEGGHIELTARLDGDDVILSVQDNGVGIEPQMLTGVFDLFTQAPRSLDRSQGGLGIGLTLVKSIVEMHGGSVTAHSAGVGQGTRVDVRLTRASAPATTGTEGTSGDPLLEGRRILVVEDHVGTAKVLARLLERLGPHTVHMAHDGLSALETAREIMPDLILLDIGLPRMHGYDVARQLRQDPGFSNTLLVALTGYGQSEDREKSRSCGFDIHLVKPMDINDLKQVLTHPRLSRTPPTSD